MKTWDAVLRDIGWPDRALVFDLESYFDKKVTLSKMSQTEYLAHPLFKLTCVGSGLVESGELHGTTDDLNGEIARLQTEYGRNLESVTVVGMNLFFDVGILNDKFGILPPYTVDVRDLSHYLWPHEMKHALKNIAERLGLPCKGDTKEFLGYTPETAFPFMRDELAAYNERDLEITEKAFTKMLPMVGRPEWEIPFASHHLKMFCRDTMKIDRPALTKISEILEAKMLAAASVTEYTAKQLRSDKFTDYLLAIDPTVPLKDTKQGRRATVSKKDQELAGLLKHENPRVVALVQAKLIVEGMASFVSRCKKIMASADRVTHKLHIPFQFAKSHTGRTQGFGGINLGNLASRSGHEGDGIRDALHAWDGNWYLIGDFASIEARGVAWHAGEKKLVKAFAEGADAYCQLAEKVFGCAVAKPKKGDTSPAAKEQTRMRQVGKVGILAAGYMQGANGMGNQMALAGQLGPGVDPELPNKLVETYRDTYPAIKAMWSILMADCIAAVRHPGVLVSRTPSAWLYGKRNGEPMLTLILPSGREIYYGKAEVRRDRMGEHVKAGIGAGEGFKLWPGMCCVAGHTPVLTQRGWIRMDTILSTDMVWDGSDWTRHRGLVDKGRQSVVGVSGIDVTPDHKILTKGGWLRADAGSGLEWASVRLPDRVEVRRCSEARSEMVGSVSVWEGVRKGGIGDDFGTRIEAVPAMQYPQKREGRYARYVQSSGVRRMEVNERQMPASVAPSLEKLRRAWYSGVQRVADLVRYVLGRHGLAVCRGSYVGSHRQQRGLYSEQLPMGLVRGTSQQPTWECRRTAASGEGYGNMCINTILPTPPRTCVAQVYDLIDCGPNHCFTVMDRTGRPRLVHNCENIVQGFCRDILVEKALTLEREGFIVVWHLYDSLAVLVSDKDKEERGDEIVKKYVGITTAPISWLPGFPLGMDPKEDVKWSRHYD